MKEIRKLNKSGLEKFTSFIQAFAQGQKPPIPNELRRDDSYTSVLGKGDLKVESIDFSSQLTMARDLDQLFKGANLSPEKIADPEMWAWLSVVYFENICPVVKGGEWKPGPLNLWVPSIVWTRFYRNFLAGPYKLYSLHRGDEELLKPVLSGLPKKQTEIYAQIMGSQEVAQSKGVLATANALYWDESAGSLKWGHAGKGAGSARRFPKFINQITLTWDVNDISSEELLELLPAEFNRFR